MCSSDLRQQYQNADAHQRANRCFGLRAGLRHGSLHALGLMAHDVIERADECILHGPQLVVERTLEFIIVVLTGVQLDDALARQDQLF